MNAFQSLKLRVAAMRQGNGLAWLRWHGQRCAERLGRGGMLALAAALVLLAHFIVVLWPEKNELQNRAMEMYGELHACSPSIEPPGNDMTALRVQMRMDPDQRQLEIMGELLRAGLLLVDIQYQGEDTIQGRLRRTSLDITAIGSYQDVSTGLRKLAEHPLLRLESLALDRQRPENMLVNIKMRLSMLGVV